VVAGAAGAGAGVAAFGGAAATAPDTKATKVRTTTNRIVFFIRFTSFLIDRDVPHKGHNTNENFLSGKPRPVGEELHSNFPIKPNHE